MRAPFFRRPRSVRPAFAALLLSACAFAPPPPAGEDVAEALREAREARLEQQGQTARLQELEGQVRDLSEMIAWNAERIAAQARSLDSLRRPASGSATAPPPAPPAERARVSPDEATEYRKALDLYFARRYGEASAAFRDLLARHPQGAYAGNAEYWIGESLYGQGDYAGALAAFRRVFAHPGSGKLDDAQLKLGYCHLRLGDRARAAEEFRKLVSLYPSSEYVERARGELEKLGGP